MADGGASTTMQSGGRPACQCYAPLYATGFTELCIAICLALRDRHAVRTVYIGYIVRQTSFFVHVTKKAVWERNEFHYATRSPSRN